MVPVVVEQGRTGVSTPLLAIIVAVARNGVIGHDGGMPWRMPSDLRRFRRLTLGKPVIMGRKTYESIGRPLDGRTNIVVSRRMRERPAGVEVVGDVNAAVELARQIAVRDGVSEIMVIGGAEIYSELLGQAGRIYLTRIDAAVAGETRFPELDQESWRETVREPVQRCDEDDYAATFIQLDRAEKVGRHA